MSSPRGHNRPVIEFDELLVVALGKIRASDGACEQHIADECHLGVLVEEDDMARRVAGAVAHTEFRLADGHRVPVFEPAVGRAILRVAETGALGVAAHLVQQIGVIPVRALDGHAELAGQLGGTPGMVEMPVRQEDLLQGHPFKLQGLLDPVQVTARVDNGASIGARTPHQRTILLIGGDGQDCSLDRGHIHAISNSGNSRVRPTLVRVLVVN